MTSQTGTQAITINTLLDISKSKGNQTMRTLFVQLIEHNIRRSFFKSHALNEAGKLVPDLFFSFTKALYELKASG